jgi:hypothetical protein
VALRAVIFGLTGVLTDDDPGDKSTGLAGERGDALTAEVRELFDYLREKKIRPIVLSNRNWTFTDNTNGRHYTIDEFVATAYGEAKLYVANRGDLPHKPQKECIEALLKLENLERHEVIYVGNSTKDFRTAVNSGLLYLNAVWDKKESDYGFVFESPRDIIRFIDLFALKTHPWFYALEKPVRYRSLAPFSTFKEAYAQYSAAARAAAKQGTPQRHFFLNSTVASLYFSGMMADVDRIACIPGHHVGYGNPAMNDVLQIVGKVFATKYLPDLIVRHMDTPGQRNTRNTGGEPEPVTQINSIYLTKHPLKNETDRYSDPIKLKGQTVLVFDDFCTRGYSFEAARMFLERAGAHVMEVSWLKTINRDYTVVKYDKSFDPYSPLTVDRSEIRTQAIPYVRGIVDHEAPAELTADFQRFVNWKRR